MVVAWGCAEEIAHPIRFDRGLPGQQRIWSPRTRGVGTSKESQRLSAEADLFGPGMRHAHTRAMSRTSCLAILAFTLLATPSAGCSSTEESEGDTADSALSGWGGAARARRCKPGEEVTDCIPESTNGESPKSSSGTTPTPGEGERCDTRCKSGLECEDRVCVSKCSSIIGCSDTTYSYCVPDDYFSVSGTCRKTPSGLGDLCFNRSSCHLGLKCGERRLCVP